MSKILTHDRNDPDARVAKHIFVTALHADPNRIPQFEIKGTPGRLWHLERDRANDSDTPLLEHINELKANGFFDAELRAFGRVSQSHLAAQLSSYMPLHTFAFQRPETPPLEVPHTITDGFPGATPVEMIVDEHLNDEGFIHPFDGPNPYPGDIFKYSTNDSPPSPAERGTALHEALERNRGMELGDATPFTPEEAASWKVPTLAEVLNNLPPTQPINRPQRFAGHDDGIRRKPPTIEPKTSDSTITTQAEAKRMVGEFFETLSEGHGKTPYQLVLDYHEWLKIRTHARQLERYGKIINDDRGRANHPAGRNLPKPGTSNHSPRGTYSYDTATHHYEIRQDPITDKPLEAKAYNLTGVYGVDDIESRRTLKGLIKSWEAFRKPDLDI